MILFKILQAFLLPSVFVFILMLLGVGLILIKKKRAGKIILILGIVLYYLFSITPVSDFLISILENQHRYPTKSQIDSIDTVVVLSGGIKNRNLLLPSALGNSTLFRLTEALKIYFLKEEKPLIIVSGTSPIDRIEKESLFGAKFLESFNVPKEKIIWEVMSGNTFQHAREVKKIIKDEPFLLITSAYHMPRAIKTFQKAGLSPIALPTDYQYENFYTILSFLPQAENLKKSNLAFHEYFGILFYRLFGYSE